MIYDKSGNQINAVYSLNGNQSEQAYDISGNNVFSHGHVLKIMSYNVGQWYIGNSNKVPTEKKSVYYDLQHGIFENNPVDILFLQEYLDQWCDDGSYATTDFIDDFFNNQEVTTPTGYIGHSICAKDHELLDYATHAFSANRSSYPSFETAKITIGGKTINVINTHNDFQIDYQRINVTELLAAVADMEYFILAGDFNIDLAVEETTGNQYQNSVKRFIDAGYHVGNCVVGWIRTYFGTSSTTGGKFTDQIVTSANIQIENVYADTSKLTDPIGDKIDHLPLIAELRIN